MKKALPITVILLLLTLSITPFATAQQAEKNIVNIPDPSLRTAIEVELGKDENAPISEADMLTLEVLTLDSLTLEVDIGIPGELGIADLSGLEFATNLRQLDLWDNNSISDVSPLKNLVNLEYLGLSYNSISDVSPLKNLVNLEWLGLSGNSVSDVSPLKNLVNLKELYLSSNSVSDVSPLKDLVNLEILSLQSNSISDVSPLKNLVNLEHLYLRDNAISDVSPLKDLVKLKYLDIRGNPVHNVDQLSHLTAKIEIDPAFDPALDGGGLSDVPVSIPDANLRSAIASQLGKDENAPISEADMWTLGTLELQSRGIKDLTGLEFATNLRRLDFESNSISDLSPLKKLVNLEKLYLSHNSISDLSPLKDLVKLEWLWLSLNSISDVSPLKKLVKLENLDLSNNAISNVSHFKHLVKLKYLDLSNNAISDISPLKDLVKLEDLVKLDLDHNAISNVSPLKELVNLTWLALRDNSISDVSPLKKLVNLEYLDLRNNLVHNVDQLSHLTAKIDIDPELAGGGLSDVSVSIPDANLRSVIASQLGKDENAPISEGEMLILDVLTPTLEVLIGGIPEEHRIADLSGLEFATNLRQLDLWGNSISDLSPLKKLVNLEILYLSHNSISDVSPLKELVKLEALHLRDNAISDVSPLKNLVKLEALHLRDNAISDVSPLKNLVNLEYLDLRGNPVHNVDQLSHLTAEIEIHPALAGGGLSDVPVSIPDANLRSAIASLLGKDENAPIFEADMRTLETLELQSREIKDLTGLEFAANLRQLNLWDNSISDVSPLKDLVRLKTLWLYNNAISDVSPLKDLVHLGSLWLPNNDISDVSPLKDLVHLKTLWLSNNAISDVSPLEELVNLTWLDLENNAISDVLPLKNLVNLKTLKLRGNPVYNVDQLSHLTAKIEIDPALAGGGIPDANLRRAINSQLGKAENDPISDGEMATLENLSLESSNIRYLSGLQRASQLRILNLSNNNISDVSPLKDLVNLEVLSLDSNTISDVSPLKDLVNLETLSLERNLISDVSPLKDLIKLKILKLLGNPLHSADQLSHLTAKIEIDPALADGGLSDLPISIPDPILRSEIAAKLGKAENDPISEKDMWTLIELIASHDFNSKLPQIVDLTGLEFAHNMRVLYLSHNSISDLSPLKGLVNLETLALWRNNISDVSPLKDLVNLETLSFEHNLISDVSPLKNLVNLEYLYLTGNPVHNVDQLSHLTAKIEIDPALAGGGFSADPIIIPDANLRSEIATKLGKDENDPIFEADMVRMVNLWLKLREIKDLTGLEFARNLETLDLRSNNISDLSPLKGLVNLETLALWRNNISDVSPLQELVNLKSLTLWGNTISDVSPLKELVNLKSLNLWENSISDVSPLKDLVKLESLVLGSNSISDVSPLKHLVKLERLDLGSNSISDVSPLKDLVKLESLVLGSNSISDVSPLKNLVNLGSLWLLNNAISDVSPLKHLVKLERLDLRSNNISDVSPLQELVNLKSLNLWGNPVRNAYTLSHLSANIAGVTLHPLGCHTLMPETIEPLKQVRVPRHYEKTEVSRGIFEYQESTGSVKAAVAADEGRANRTWTIHDTVAEEEKGEAELELTVKFLSPTEARRLIPLKGMNLDALVSPKEKLIDKIKRAAKDWAMDSNIRWEYIMPGKSGKSDIRIAFLDPEKQSLFQSKVGSPSDDNTEYDRSVTMVMSTNVSYGTILHEFGHALGLTHEHLNPQFADWFEWDDSEPFGWADPVVWANKFPDDKYPDLEWDPIDEWDSIDPDDRIYKKIAFYLVGFGFNPKTIEKGDPNADTIDLNILKTRDIDEEYSEFDPDSIMTYGIRASLLKLQPGAPRPAWDLATFGIPSNGKLSDRDRKFIADLYGQPLQKAQISGTVEIDGIDNDLFGSNDKIKTTKSVSETVMADAAEYVRAHDPIKFKWGGEMRVEVYIHSREINYRDQFVEVAVTALLYHSLGSENSTDLDAYICLADKIPLNGELKANIRLSNSFPGFSGSKWCGGFQLNAEKSGLTGDLLGGVNWWNKADLTIKLTLERVDRDTPVTAPAAPSIAAIVKTADPKHDINGDGEINAADLLLVSQYFGRIPPETPAVDVNNDDTVTIADLVQVAQYLQRSRVPAAPTASMPPKLTYQTVEGWINTARSESDGSRVFQIGIGNLEALLLLIVPKETVLLANYPNPFNPETWIPYHLSEHADVTLTIYAIDGTRVRRLDLGHQEAGYYQSKARAAYWDGRNNVGERVASGLYFYTLEAGDFADTRKMLILK